MRSACKSRFRWGILAWPFVLLAGCSDPASPSGPPATPPAASTRNPEAEALYEQARAHLEANRVLEAIGVLDEALACEDPPGRHHLLLGRALLLDSPDQDIAEAFDCFSSAAAAGEPAGTLWQAQTRILQQLPGEARTLLREYAAHPSDAPSDRVHARLLEAELAVEAGRTDGVEDLLREAEEGAAALLLRPSDRIETLRLTGIQRDAQFTRIELDLVQGRGELAREAAEQQVARFPENVAARRCLARVLEVTGDEAQSARQRRAAELLTELEAKEHRTSIELAEVEALFDELAGIEPVSPRLPLRRARACASRNQFQTAVEICQALRQRDEEDPVDRRLIAEAWYVEGSVHFQSASRMLRHHPSKKPRLETALYCYQEAAAFEPSFEGEFRRLETVILRQLEEIEAAAAVDD